VLVRPVVPAALHALNCARGDVLRSMQVA
jgi:hypothetical protein